MKYKGLEIRLMMVREAAIDWVTVKQIACSTDVVELVEDEIRDRDREVFVVVGLDGKNRPVFVEETSIGSMTAALVHPREVFKATLVDRMITRNCIGVIVCHNHPSGDPTPSREDLDLTRRLSEVGTLCGIKLLDHVILGMRGRDYSFADHGVLS